MDNAFVAIVPTRPCPLFGRPVHRRDGSHRLRPGASPHALRIPPHGGHPALPGDGRQGQRDATPAFGYGALHPSASGTSTRLNTSLPSAHYGPVRHPLAVGRLPGSAGYTTALPLLISQQDEEGFSSCSMHLCHRAVAPSPAGACRRVSQTATARIAFAESSTARPPGVWIFRGQLTFTCVTAR